MSSLYLLRHAESEPGAGADFARSLTRKGIADAIEIGRYLKSQREKLDAVVCSPARRARMTCELVLGELAVHAPITFAPEVYEASASGLAALIAKYKEPDNTLLVVGHNPGIAGVVRHLTGSAPGVGTGTLVQLVFSPSPGVETYTLANIYSPNSI